MLAMFAIALLFGATAVAVPVRVYQLIHDVDFSTGFFISMGGAYNNLLRPVVAAAVVLFIVISLLISRVTATKTALRHKRGNYIWCGVLCIAAVATLVVMVLSPREGAYTMTEWVLVSLLAVNMFALAYCAYAAYKKKEASAADILYLVPTAYTAMFLITKFLTFTSILTVSEHSLDVLALSSLVLFLLFRFNCTRGESTKPKTKILSEVFAFIGGVIGAVTYIPRAVVFFIGNQTAKSFIVLPTIWELAVMLFAFYCVVSALAPSILRSKNDKGTA
jgi:hypothetical protein